jgi:hypothetical protein
MGRQNLSYNCVLQLYGSRRLQQPNVENHCPRMSFIPSKTITVVKMCVSFAFFKLINKSDKLFESGHVPLKNLRVAIRSQLRYKKIF